MGQKLIISEEERKLITHLYGSDLISENKKIVDFIKDKIMNVILPVITSPREVIRILKSLSKKGLVTLSLLMTVLVACSEMGQEKTFDEVVKYTLEEEWAGSEDDKVFLAIYVETQLSNELKMSHIAGWAYDALKFGEREAFSRLSSKREELVSKFYRFPEEELKQLQETTEIYELITKLKEKYQKDTSLRDKLVWESLNDLKKLDSSEPLARLVQK